MFLCLFDEVFMERDDIDYSQYQDEDFIPPTEETVAEYDDPHYGEEYSDPDYCEEDNEW